MSLLSAIGSSLSGLMSSVSGGSLPLGDWSGGWTNFSSGQSKLKDALRRQYEYAQSYALNNPSWAVEGLRRAGLNPILAATDGSFSSPTLANPTMIGDGPGGNVSFGKLSEDVNRRQEELQKSQLELNKKQGELFEAQANKARSDKLHSDVGSLNDFFQGKGSIAGSVREAVYRLMSEHGSKFGDALSEIEDFLYGRSKETGVSNPSHMNESSPQKSYPDVVIPPSSSRRDSRFMNDGIRFHEDDPERFRRKDSSSKDSSRKWSYRGSHPYLPFN